MPFKGTNKRAYKKASVGETPEQRRKLYKKYKKDDERGDFFGSLFSTPKVPKVRLLKTKNTQETQRPVTSTLHNSQKKHKSNNSVSYRKNQYYKKTFLDDIRDNRSSKLVSCISNGLAKFVVREGGAEWDSKTKNTARAVIAFVAAEVINKVFEEPLKVVENVEMFVNVGKAIYKFVVWVDKTVNQLKLDEESVREVQESDSEYQAFLRKYPKVVHVES